MFLSIKFKRKQIIGIISAITACVIMIMVITSISASAEKKAGVFVPIIMYHSILKDESRWCDYVLSPVELEKDIVYLKSNGYTPIFVNDLISYVEYGEKLPSKPVIITFDDGYYNNYTYLFPLLKKYDFKATISVVGSFTENAASEEPDPNYSCLRWQDIKEMRDSGYVEICNHTFDMHSNDMRKGASRMSDESYEDYRGVFIKDIFKMQDLCENYCGFKPNVFTYPFGAHDESSDRLVKNCGFSASLGVEGKPNYIVEGDTDCLYYLNRYNRPSFVSTEDFMEKALHE